MTKTSAVPVATTIDLSKQTVGLERESGRAVLMPPRRGGPPERITGYTVEAGFIEGEPPHGGEMHPDADELLYLISGRVEVVLELDDGERRVEVDAGQAIVVPQGTWHQIYVIEPGQLLNITPGPHGDARPKPSTG